MFYLWFIDVILRDLFLILSILLTVDLFLGAQRLKCYELPELLERLQSSGCYGALGGAHTPGVAQNQKQPYFPNT